MREGFMNSSGFRLIACDMDETLLTDGRQVSEKNRKAIAAAAERGVKFVPATGRGYTSIAATLKDLDLLGKKDEYVISLNGGILTENAQNTVLAEFPLRPAAADALYRFGVSQGLCTHAYTRDQVYVWNFVPEEEAYMKGRAEVTVTDRRDLSFLDGRPVLKVLFMDTDMAYLRRLEKEAARLAGGLDATYSAGRYLEFNPGGVSKGAGLRRLAEHLGISTEATIAIGDHFNDLSMIQAAGLGVGVANAAAEIKPFCDYVTRATNNEDAVAEVIERFVL